MALVAPTHLAGGGLCWPRAECRQISPLLLKGSRPPDLPALSVVNHPEPAPGGTSGAAPDPVGLDRCRTEGPGAQRCQSAAH